MVYYAIPARTGNTRQDRTNRRKAAPVGAQAVHKPEGSGECAL